MEKIPLLIIGGATASGKTAVAAELARRLGGEIVSADSMQIYSGISIGTARATEEELGGVPIHLSGCVPLEQKFSVAQYTERAAEIIKDIHSRNKPVVLCGGTGLYISSLIDNISFSQCEPDEELRSRLSAMSNEQLMEKLQQVDEVSAQHINIADKKRLVRALEIYMQTGITLTEQNRLSKLQPSPYNVCYICVGYKERAALYSRIESRVDDMIARGLVSEARYVLQNGGAGTVMQAIGYKELLSYIQGECSLEQAVETLKRDTRRYAKRQLTWFRRDERVHWLYAEDFSDLNRLCDEAQKIYAERTARR